MTHEDHPTTGLYVFVEPKSPWALRCYGFHFHGAPAEKAWEMYDTVREHFDPAKWNIRTQNDNAEFTGRAPSVWRKRRIRWTCAEYVGPK